MSRLLFASFSSQFKHCPLVLCRRLPQVTRQPQCNLVHHQLQREKRLSEFDPAKDIERDTLLYENVNFGSIWKVQIASWFNFIVWTYLVFFALYYLQLNRRKEDSNNRQSLWKRILSFEERHKNAILVSCFTVALGGVAVVAAYAQRNINRIIIRPKPSGLQVSISTHTFVPSKFVNTIQVPLSHVSCMNPRVGSASSSPFVTLKVKGKLLFYLIDKRKGSFVNPYLFDRTVGLSRSLK